MLSHLYVGYTVFSLFIHRLISTSVVFAFLGYCKCCCNKNWSLGISLTDIFGYIPKSKIRESCGSPTLNFLRNLQISTLAVGICIQGKMCTTNSNMLHFLKKKKNGISEL
jgi:hypothetical protein